MNDALRTLAAALFVALPALGGAETRLLMAEEQGCPWCARWNSEVGDAYDRTAEGRAAPLLRFDIHGDPPPGVTLARGVYFTPTFILVRDGTEVSRMEGYPGEDFFWGLLNRMLEDAAVDLNEKRDG